VRLALAAWGLGALWAVAGESFPVVHRELITVRVLNGRSGKPLAHRRITLIAGYNEKDLRQKLWGEEAVTDAIGEVRVPRVLGDFSFLEVRVAKAKLCQGTSRGEMYNVSRIRREGLNAPNRCGLVTVAQTLGVLVVFAGGQGEADPPAKIVAQETNVDFTAGPGVRAEAERARPTAWAGNEIDTLVGRRSPERDPDEDGTAEFPGAYDVMCQPEE